MTNLFCHYIIDDYKKFDNYKNKNESVIMYKLELELKRDELNEIISDSGNNLLDERVQKLSRQLDEYMNLIMNLVLSEN